jgi:DNA-binding transcriptional LysR family regulator
MRIEQMQAFLAVAQTGNFQRAATQCKVTQSTISRQIQGLEDDLGMPVFHRSGQNKLTIAGECLLPKAKRILSEWEEALGAIAALKDGLQTELCVAAIHSVCAHYLPPVLQLFCERHPHIQLRVTSLGSDRSLKVLRDGLVDLAIVMNTPSLTQQPETVVDKLYDEPIQVLMAANHPLAHYEIVPWVELARFPHVVFKDGYGMQRLVQEQFKKLGLVLNAAIELNTLDAFRGVIRQSDMISLLPRGALVESQIDPSLAVRALGILTDESGTGASILTREVVMVTTTDRLLIPPIANFREMVRDHLRSVLQADVLKADVLKTMQPVLEPR